MDFAHEKPPKAVPVSSHGAGREGASGSQPESVVPLGKLTKRAEYLRVRGGKSWRTKSFVLVSRPRPPKAETATDLARFGFTVTKKIGKAVRRNRAKRRLKEAVRLTAAKHARAGFDYVVIARAGAVDQAFAVILKEFESAFGRLHSQH